MGHRQPGTGHLLTREFARADISDLRHAVSHCAAATGLSSRPLDDFVLAVNELVTNAVRHGGGTGQLRLWATGDDLVCEVSDNGGGIVGRAGDGHRKPAPNVVGGWGLWLARRLSGTMSVTTGGDGTVVRISTPLPGRALVAPPGSGTAVASPPDGVAGTLPGD